MEENIISFLKKCVKHEEGLYGETATYYDFDIDTEHNFFCNTCLANRRMKTRKMNIEFKNYYGKDLNGALDKCSPLLYELNCLQCQEKSYLFIYKNHGEFKSVILSEKNGGCLSKNAPEGVKYYLGQAYNSRMIGAQSASMAMYRAAMDFMLYDQGYRKGMLGEKIKNLEKDISEKSAPKWAMEIDVDYMKAIKEIGNSAIHPNDGEIKKQKEIDGVLLNIVDTIFLELLDKIYDQPARSKENLEILRSKNVMLSSKKD